MRTLLNVLIRATLVGATLLVGTGAPAQQPELTAQPQLDLQRTRLTAGMYRIDAQVAATPRERMIGLMFRTEMPHDEGMIFVFDQPAQQCFWMRNTFIPLSAAFVADDGRIVNIEDMAPRSDASHCSKEPVRYVLEMNQGWFANKRIKAGFKLGGPLFANAR